MTRIGVLGLLVLAWSIPGSAQTTHELRVYALGAPAPLQTTTITAFTCGVFPKVSGSTVNPTTVAWDDPADPTRDCVALEAATLLALPIGDYVGRLVAITDAGASAESADAPFCAGLPAWAADGAADCQVAWQRVLLVYWWYCIVLRLC